jgi:hypothetical protein
MELLLIFLITFFTYTGYLRSCTFQIYIVEKKYSLITYEEVLLKKSRHSTGLKLSTQRLLMKAHTKFYRLLTYSGLKFDFFLKIGPLYLSIILELFVD